MYKGFAAYIEKERLLAGCKRLLLAVSGGVDSTVLAHLAGRYRQSHPELELGWVHCNFHLRGEESERDECFVRGCAEVSGCRLYVRSFDTEAFAREKGVSIEMAARDLRYAYFAELMDSEGWDACLLAHHADDNAETFFINLFRGSGVKGLRGMLPRSVSGGHVYLRPLLFARRFEIMAYAQQQSLAFVEDSTNRQEVYLRNRIRLSLLPFLDSVQTGAVRKITQSMETLRAADSLMDDWFAEQKQKVVLPVDGRKSGADAVDAGLIDLRASLAEVRLIGGTEAAGARVADVLTMEALARMGLNPVLRGCRVGAQEILPGERLSALGRHRALFWELYLREKSFSRLQIAQILQNEQAGTSGKIFENADNSGVLVREPQAWRWVALEEASGDGEEGRGEPGCLSDGAKGGTRNLSGHGGRWMQGSAGDADAKRGGMPETGGRCADAEALLHAEEYSQRSLASIPGELMEKGPGPAGTFEIKSIGSKAELDTALEKAYLAYDKLRFPLHWRHWQAGDRFQPLGMKGFKKLSDFFTGLKLSLAQKEAVWLLCSGDDIVWVAGYRIDDRYKMDFSSAGKKKALVLQLAPCGGRAARRAEERPGQARCGDDGAEERPGERLTGEKYR